MTPAFERRGSGPPVLLLHGIGARREMWDPVVSALAGQRETIAVDLPGFGESAPLPAGASPGPESLADAVASLISELGLVRPHVAGNSLGGWIALILARRGLVASAATLSSAGFANDREQAFANVSLMAARRGLRAIRPAIAPLASTAAGRVALGGQYFARPWRIPSDTATKVFEGYADCPSLEATLAGIKRERPFTGGGEIAVPVTIAWGSRDHLLLPRQAARAARAIPGSRQVSLEGCGHCPFWDDTAAVARAVLDGTPGS